jgi:hypothetical protein
VGAGGDGNPGRWPGDEEDIAAALQRRATTNNGNERLT